MNFLMLSCRKATSLIEKKSMFRLSLKEQVQLHIHSNLCDACSSYQKQSEQIDRLVEQEQKRPYTSHEHVDENRALKNRIIKLLETPKF